MSSTELTIAQQARSLAMPKREGMTRGKVVGPRPYQLELNLHVELPEITQ